VQLRGFACRWWVGLEALREVSLVNRLSKLEVEQKLSNLVRYDDTHDKALKTEIDLHFGVKISVHYLCCGSHWGWRERGHTQDTVDSWNAPTCFQKRMFPRPDSRSCRWPRTAASIDTFTKISTPVLKHIRLWSWKKMWNVHPTR
jgi:hypothetical protein